MIPSIGKPKISYKDHSTVNFESLEFYVILAQKIIAKFSNGISKHMLKDDDAIAFVANAIMMGDWRWKDNKDLDQNKYKSLYSYRNQCGIWAIKTYVTKFYKNKKSKKNLNSYSLNHSSIEDNAELSTIIPDNNQINPLDILIKQEEHRSKQLLIQDILKSDLLSDKQKEYIQLYFFENLTLDKIGKKFGVTREAVRQSIKVSMEKIKNLL